MPKRTRWRRLGMWLGIGVAALCLVAWVGSGWYEFGRTYRTLRSETTVFLRWGCLEVNDLRGPPSPGPPAWLQDSWIHAIPDAPVWRWSFPLFRKSGPFGT